MAAQYAFLSLYGFEDEVWEDFTKLRQDLSRVIPNIRTLRTAVRNLTVADLTCPEDILDTFAGVDTELSRCYNGEFISGLPAAFFHIAVLWEPFGIIQRRKAQGIDRQSKLPSWSWVGWKGDVRVHIWEAAMDFLIDGGDEYGPWSHERVAPLFEWKYYGTLADPGSSIRNIWYKHRKKFSCSRGKQNSTVFKSLVTLPDEAQVTRKMGRQFIPFINPFYF
jgi:hypothetical protein